MNKKTFWQRNLSDKAQRQIARDAKKFNFDKKAMNIAYNMDTDLDAFDPALSETLMPPEEDLAYGIEKDLFRLLPLHDHDEIVRLLRTTIQQIDKSDLVNAFVASLTVGRPDWCSPLASYAYHLHHPAHTADDKEISWADACKLECRVCGFYRDKDLSGPTAVNRLFHLRGGGICHDSPDYALADLMWFQSSDKIEATAADWKTLATIFNTIRALPADADLKELNNSLTGLVSGNKYDRQRLLETLGYCGILTARSLSPVCNTWFAPQKENLPSHFYKKEWRYPTCWWTGEEGLNQEAIDFWFPDLGRQ